MKRQILAVSLFFVSNLFALQTFAAGNDDFLPANALDCESALSGQEFDRTEAFRKGLWEGLQKRVGQIKSAREDYANLLNLHLENRADFAPSANITGALAQTLGLGAGQQREIPLVARSTHEAIQRFMENTERARYQELRKSLEETLHADPYFRWLKQSGIDGRRQGDQFQPGQYTLSDDGLDPVRVSADPVSYFFSRVDISGPATLPSDISLIRVYRDLDPELTPEMHSLADGILNLYAIEVVLQLDYREQFRWRNNGWASKEAWDLAPNLRTAIKNYRALLDKQKKLDVHMSQRGYNLARRLYNEQGEGVDLLRRIINDRKKSGDEEAFVKLKTELTLDQKFSAREVFDLIVYAGNPRVSRVQFMMRKFGGDEGRLDDRTLTGLRKIIEVAEALRSNEAFQAFIREAIQAHQ